MSVKFTVVFVDWLAVNSPRVFPFCRIVRVPLLTVGIVGLLDKSLYDPLVATVARSAVSTLPAIAVETSDAVW